MTDAEMDADLQTTLRLVRDAQSGDRAALDGLFERYLPRTRRIVAARMGWKLGQVLEHEDIVQEALTEAFRALDRFEARSAGSFRLWLAQIVENTIRNAARDAQRLKRGGGAVRRWSELANESLVAMTLAGDDPTASAIARAAELEDRIETILLELPKRYRDAIVLKSFCELSYAEMLEPLGVTNEATARQVCFRALKELRERLGT
jgi:RNA polymerase sigma factor (sigma-70 family)